MSYISIKKVEAIIASPWAFPLETTPVAVGDIVMIVSVTATSLIPTYMFTDSARTIQDTGFTQIYSTTPAMSSTRGRIWWRKLTSSDIDGSGNLNKAWYMTAAKFFGIILHAPGGFPDNPILDALAHCVAGSNGMSVCTDLAGAEVTPTNHDRPQFVGVFTKLESAGAGLVYTWDNAVSHSTGVSGATGNEFVNDTGVTAAMVGEPVTNSSGYIPAKTMIGSVDTVNHTFSLVDEAGNPVALTGNITQVTIGGPKLSHTPYFNNSTATDIDGGGTWSANVPGTDGHHYGVSTGNLVFGDFWLYDEGDTPKNITQSIGMAGAHVTLVVNLEANPSPTGEMSGKATMISSAKGTILPTAIYMDGNATGISYAEGTLVPTVSAALPPGKGTMISAAAAPAGMADAVASPVALSGSGKLILTAKGTLYTAARALLSGKAPMVLQAKGTLTPVLPTITPGLQPYLTWDKVGDRSYQSGLDRGVLYLEDGRAVPWNGLTSVVEKSNIESSPIYYDGRKIGDSFTIGEFSGTIKAITYPDEFTAIEGRAALRRGALLGNQRPQTFDLSYRTLIGNDVDANAGYKIHLLYNATAIPTDRTHETLNDQSDTMEFEWEITAIPEDIPGLVPSSYLVFDSTLIDPWLLQNIEGMLWGNGSVLPKLPTLQELVSIIENWYRMEVTDNGDGTWTASSNIPGMITMLTEDEFQLNGVNAVMLDSDTYEISNT